MLMPWRLFLVLAPTALVGMAQAKDCLTNVSRGKELKKLVQQAHVLVALLPEVEESNDGDEDDESSSTSEEDKGGDANFKELCERLRSTPEARVEDFEVVSVTDPILRRKVKTSSRPAPSTWQQRLSYKLESYFSF